MTVHTTINSPRDLYKWAAAIMDARCFPSSALANNQLVGDYSDAAPNGVPPEIDPDSPVLIPGMDLANHGPTANVTWLYNREDCCLVSDDPYKGGQQIWNNYGPKANEQRELNLFNNRWVGSVADIT